MIEQDDNSYHGNSTSQNRMSKEAPDTIEEDERCLEDVAEEQSWYDNNALMD